MLHQTLGCSLGLWKRSLLNGEKEYRKSTMIELFPENHQLLWAALQALQLTILSHSHQKITMSISKQTLWSSHHMSAHIDVNQAVECYSQHINLDSCKEALDCLFFIYKTSSYSITSCFSFWANISCAQVSQKTFIANIMTQVIKHHIIHSLEKIFLPVVVNALLNHEKKAIALKLMLIKRQRGFLKNRIEKLNKEYNIL